MGTIQQEVSFRAGQAKEREIVCGRANTVRLVDTYFPSEDCDMPQWLYIKPGSQRTASNSDVWVTLVFGGSDEALGRLCRLGEIAEANMNSERPYTLLVRFAQ